MYLEILRFKICFKICTKSTKREEKKEMEGVYNIIICNKIKLALPYLVQQK